MSHAAYWQSRLLWELARKPARGGTAALAERPMSGARSWSHQSVLLAESISALVTDPGGLYLDATLGLGGHSEALLKALSPRGRVLGLDMDPESLHEAEARLKGHGERFKSVRANFRTLASVLEAERFFPLAGALFDLGVSSLHFDKPERGFSFMAEGPLDMRLSPDNPLRAEAIVNRWPEEQLELLLKEYGEEPAARSIARAIVRRRKEKPFDTTTELARHIETVVPRKGGSHPATRTFMALRIAVNAELENLTRGLEAALPYLQTGGRVAVISFHSLEDRIVKRLFASFVDQGLCRYPEGGPQSVKPSAAEIERNARARSAKLRVVEKL